MELEEEEEVEEFEIGRWSGTGREYRLNHWWMGTKDEG